MKCSDQALLTHGSTRRQREGSVIPLIFSSSAFPPFYVLMFLFFYSRILIAESRVSHTWMECQVIIFRMQTNLHIWDFQCLILGLILWSLYILLDTLKCYRQYEGGRQNSFYLRKASCTDNSAEISHECHKSYCSMNWKTRDITTNPLRNSLLLVLEVNFK